MLFMLSAFIIEATLWGEFFIFPSHYNNNNNNNTISAYSSFLSSIISFPLLLQFHLLNLTQSWVPALPISHACLVLDTLTLRHRHHESLTLKPRNLFADVLLRLQDSHLRLPEYSRTFTSVSRNSGTTAMSQSSAP
jgi:hypothetical protein